jgi:hypothetical protein
LLAQENITRVRAGLLCVALLTGIEHERTFRIYGIKKPDARALLRSSSRRREIVPQA